MTPVCAAIVLLFSQSGARQHMVHEIYSKTLPAGSKPSLVPAPLRGKKVISAGEYLVEEQHVMRLYRYSFKGDVDKFVNAAMPQLKGWRKDIIADNTGKPQPGEGYDLTGPVLSGHVRRQSMLIVKGRFVPDKKAKFGARKDMATGWISVSLNEELR